MYDPSMRVLTVLELLQTRGRISARELQERLTEVWLEADESSLYYDLLPPISTLTLEGSGLTLRCGVNDLDAYAARLLALGCALTVRAPDELRDAFTGLSKRAAHLGGRPPT